MQLTEEFGFDIFRDDFCFETTALEIFRLQYENNEVYRRYVQLLGVQPENITQLYQIPFLPVRFFKSHKVVTGNRTPEIIFTSSGTTGQITSKHYVSNLALYRESLTKGFELFYGKPEEWCILALLPSYLEREGSSLVYMCEQLIEKSNHVHSGFYLHDYKKLTSVLKSLEQQKQKTLLIGVSYALLDLAEQYPQQLQYTTIMETGGMKGKRKEMTKEALHEQLKKSFQKEVIHSEYGMTEMLSQAYSDGNGIYHCPPWLKLMVRDSYDPLSPAEGKRAGGVNVIDLANRYSCSFVATQDLGKLNADGTFEIAGRLNDAELRGCNLMIE
ncbi:MAG: acyl transferase [Bacteroidetes bacterium]|jgi:phenylacetate-coenzyme A ligase PaaK-like adenylate-forming protein|nr:acyl transferase [Bacteroidota bacterium]